MNKLLTILTTLVLFSCGATAFAVDSPPDSDTIIYPKNHGAICDGAHDDTLAIMTSQKIASDRHIGMFVTKNCIVHGHKTTNDDGVWYKPQRPQ
jgi:hypothetical protein